MRHVLCALALVTAMPVAHAERPAPPPVQKLDFENDNVEGDVPRPDDRIIDGRNRPRWSSLIRVRIHFFDQLLRSTEDR